MGSIYKRQLNDWKATLDVKAKLLFDIGGAQDPLKGKTKSWDVEECKIVDLETPHVLTTNPDLVQDMNYSLSGEIERYIGAVDAVFMLGVMDYVINPNVALQNVASLLTEDGYAWIEWPFVYCTHEPVMEEGCRYSEGCVNRLVKQAGLEITEMVRKMSESGLLVAFYSAEGQRMAKSYDYHGVTGFITKVRRQDGTS